MVKDLLLIMSFLLLCLSSALALPSSEQTTSGGRYHALRLSPGQDLKVELTRYIKEHELKACSVVTCVGSLTEANIRYANEPGGSLVEGPLEIVSLSGCGGLGKWHLHLSVADKTGSMKGGHLMDGCLVRTTAEIVLVELPELQFDRVHDPESGYPELKVNRR